MGAVTETSGPRLNLLIRGGTLVGEQGVWAADLGVRDGRIAAILAPGERVAAAEVLDAAGLHLLPGLVDQHVHFNEPGRTHWEGFETGSRAAAAGGVTTVIEMPLNSHPPTTTAEALELKQTTVAGKAVVDYAFWGGLVDDNVAALPALHAGGVVGVKAFMSHAGTDDYPFATDHVLFEGLKTVARLGTVLDLHAENDSLTRGYAEQLRAAGRIDRRAYAESRPPVAELEAIERGILLARQADPNARIHFVHVSIGDGARAVERARRDGQPVSLETCPHYLTLDEDRFAEIGPDAKCAPPIRPRDVVEDLWACVLEGLVDSFASDHSPCPPEDKSRGDQDIWLAWGGVSGVQTMLPLLLDEGVHNRGLPLPRLVRMASANPARIVGLWPRKGHLGLGADADIALVDLARAWTLEPNLLQTRHPVSPFIGYRFRGAVIQTLVRGVTVFRDGEIVAPPAHGQFLRPLPGPRAPPVVGHG